MSTSTRGVTTGLLVGLCATLVTLMAGMPFGSVVHTTAEPLRCTLVEIHEDTASSRSDLGAMGHRSDLLVVTANRSIFRYLNC